MGKKSKDRGNPKPESVLESDSSTVFSKLFGHAPSPEPDAPTSFFSAHNPFRTKHGEDPFQLDKELGSELADPHPKDVGVELSKKDKKKKKRAKDEIDGADPVKGEKYKQEEEKESEIDGAMNPNSEKGIPDSPIVTSDKKEKKHKRKRDELEREYEEKNVFEAERPGCRFSTKQRIATYVFKVTLESGDFVLHIFNVYDLYYASLKEKPMDVGSMSMISTANYEARKYGVRAAMPGFITCKLCPGLIFVPTYFEKYTYYNSLTRKVFQRYDDNFMASSLDEAYLDITEVCKEKGLSGAQIAEELRRDVFEETGLTCSVGVAPNRLLAKVCSYINKPNGQFVLPNDKMDVMTFISSLHVRKIGGIGKVTERILKDVLGIYSCEDMVLKSSFLCALFSRSSEDFFLSVGLGLGETDLPEARSRKSIEQ